MYEFTESEKDAIMLAIGHCSRECFCRWEAGKDRATCLKQITVFLSIANKLQPESYTTMDIDEYYAEMTK